MAEGTGASFIPKNTNRVRKPRTSRRIYVFSYVSYILFFGTLLSVVGTFLYARQVEGTRVSLQQELAAEQSRFSQADIEQVRDLEKRLIVANQLLEETNAPSRVFQALEATIADPLRLVDFTYERLANNTVVLTFSGATDTFDAAIFQRDLMEAVPGLTSLSVVDFNYAEIGSGDTSTETDQLTLTFEGTVPASLFVYEPPQTETIVEEQPATEATTTSATVGTTTDDVTEDEQ